LFRRAQLKALVSIHGKEAGRGGDLTHDETTIIQGALDLTEKTVLDSMTPIESTFSLDIQSKLDWETLEKILARGHSRVPVYDGNPRNIIGLLLVKSLVTVRAEDETPLSAVSIRRMPRVGSDMPLYDILNEFQKGGSHMAAVIKSKQQRKDVRLHHQESTMDGSDGCNCESGDKDLEKGIQIGAADNDENRPEHSSQNGEDNGKKEQSHIHSDDPLGGSAGQIDDVEEGEVIGIITLEDVMEELLQEEILDETDEFIDVHRRVRVAAVAAAQVNRAGSLVRRVGSFSHPQLGLSKQGQHAVNKVREVQDWRQKSLAAIDNDITTPLLGVDRT
jgi:metal transporter CNNM